LSAPVDEVPGRRGGQAFPPHVAVVGEGNVGEDCILLECQEPVGIGLGAGIRGHREEARFGGNGIETAIGAGTQPGNVIADRLDLPAREAGFHHGQIRLAAGTRGGGGDVADDSGRRRKLQDGHVFGKPPLPAGRDRGEAQRQRLLAEEGVPAIARAISEDFLRFGKVGDANVVGVAGPGYVVSIIVERAADGMDASDKVAFSTEGSNDLRTHAGHESHVGHDVRRVSELHTDAASQGTDRSHAKRDDIHRAAAHAA
jgi:hypothetical protein